MTQEQRPEEDARETLWGIKQADRPWFQTLTIVGGTIVALINTVDRVNGASGATADDPLLYRIATDIVTGYLAAGLTTWTILYVKEVIVTLADVIRRKAQEREDRRVREAEERAMEMVETRAAEMANELAREAFIRLVDQLNRNEAGSSEVRFSRDDLLQLMEEQSRNGDSTRKSEG